MNPWWNEQTSTYIGALGGGGLGSLAGVVGALIGCCAPRGICKIPVLSVQIIITLAGVAALGAGLLGKFDNQPGYVTFPLLLMGGILATVPGCLLPLSIMIYRIADARRAEDPSAPLVQAVSAAMNGVQLTPATRAALLEMWGPEGFLRRATVALMWPLLGGAIAALAAAAYGAINRSAPYDWLMLAGSAALGWLCIGLLVRRMRMLVERVVQDGERQRLAAEELRRG